MEKLFMQKALEMAVKGYGLTSPNPCVGAVIVKNGKILASGWHKKSGEKHAEIMAIDNLKKKSDAHGAELYVTLEPCCHYGKTPPCANAIIKCGFKKVFVGMKDPNKKVSGKGIAMIRQNGIGVEILKSSDRLANEISLINQPFLKWIKTGIPYVTLKSGMTLDGKIATSVGESQWITSEKSRNDAKEERSFADAVLVGRKTVNKDNPLLDPLKPYSKKSFLKVILDGKLLASPAKKIFGGKNVFVACTDQAGQKNILLFKKRGIPFHSFGKNSINIEKLLKYLGKEGITHVFVEGGSDTNGSFFDAAMQKRHLLDRVVFYIAPKIMGGKNSLSVIGGNGVKNLAKILKLRNLEIKKNGGDLKISGVINVY